MKLTPLFVLVAIVFAISIILSLLKKPSKNGFFPYVRAKLLSPAELEFFKALLSAVDDRQLVFPKIRLADILDIKKGLSKKSRQSALNRIWSKHVDFTIFSKDTLEVVYVVELDDASHNEKHRQSRDSFVDDAMKAANIEIRHFKVSRTYDPKQIAAELKSTADQNQRSDSPKNDTSLAAKA